MGRSTDKEIGLSEQRKYRSWTAKQKVAIVLAGAPTSSKEQAASRSATASRPDARDESPTQ